MGGLFTKEKIDPGMDAESFVKSKIESKKVVVFSKPYCPFCTQAKNALKKFNLSPEVYEVIEVDSLSNGSEIMDYLHKITGSRTVPRVFIAGKCIGGGSETSALAASGELEALLKQAGAL